MSAPGPEEIRLLRGEQTRAAFARRVGVAPLTVYRWELPDGAAEARRPRGRILATLLARTGRAAEGGGAGEGAGGAGGVEETAVRTSVATRGVAAGSSSSGAPIAAARATLASGNWRRAEQALVVALAGGKLPGQGDSASAACLLLRLRYLSQGDVRAAFSAVLPLLGQLDRGVLEPEVEADVHVTAALIFAQPDGDIFDPGKVHAHLARAQDLLAELPDELSVLAWLARGSVAFHLGDQVLVGRVLAEAPLAVDAIADPLLQCAMREAEGLSAVIAGNPALARRRFEEAEARAAGVPLWEARALSFLALRLLDDGEDPALALGLVTRARERVRAARLGPGMPALFIARSEGEALSRLARFPEAEAAFAEAEEVADQMGWSALPVAHGLARLYARTGRGDALRALAERMLRYDRYVQRALCHAAGRMFGAWASALERRDLEGAIDTLDGVLDEIAAAGGWHFLERDAVLASFAMRVQGGTLAQALVAWRRSERYLDQFPSVWMSAHHRRIAGLLACRQGRYAEARQTLAAALATFALAGDLPEQTLTQSTLAFAAESAGDADAVGLRTTADAEARRLGVCLDAAFLPLRRDGNDRAGSGGGEREAGSARRLPRSRGSAPAERLAVPIERLCLRGVSPALLGRELVQLAEEICGAPARLETPGGPLGEGQDSDPEDAIEFGDGVGGRLLLRPGGRPGECERAMLRALTQVCSLALEVAALRGLAEVPGGRGGGVRGEGFPLPSRGTGGVRGEGFPLPSRGTGGVRGEGFPLPSRGTGGVRGEGSLLASKGAGGDASDVDLDGTDPVPELLAASASMRRLKAELGRLAASRATVIIRGESGTGKEVVARALHTLSVRSRRPFVAFNCATVPRELFEGQLFGYRRGAYTGANADHDGVIRAAHGGTLFLDEIGELPLDVQPKLLRFLENGEVQPLGETRPVQVDVRVVAATHRDLGLLVREGLFREDLYYRLQVIPVHVPPLRERREDVVVLARTFVAWFTPAGQTPPVLGVDALAALVGHPWPGNVRELRNVIERAMAFAPMPAVLGAAQLHLER